jgi:hypothetical protein
MQLVNHASVEALPPVFPTEDELADPQRFAARVRPLMGAALGVPLVEASIDDERELFRPVCVCVCVTRGYGHACVGLVGGEVGGRGTCPWQGDSNWGQVLCLLLLQEGYQA